MVLYPKLKPTDLKVNKYAIYKVNYAKQKPILAISYSEIEQQILSNKSFHEFYLNYNTPKIFVLSMGRSNQRKNYLALTNNYSIVGYITETIQEAI